MGVRGLMSNSTLSVPCEADLLELIVGQGETAVERGEHSV